MPWSSDKQRRWGNSPAGIVAMGQAKVNEFNAASKGANLPEKTIKHDGAKRIESPRNILKRKKYSGSPYVTAASLS